MIRSVVPKAWFILFLSFSVILQAAEPYGLESRQTLGAYFNGKLPTRSPLTPEGWALVPSFPNLTFEDPMLLMPLPGSDDLIVGGRQGMLWRFASQPDVATKAVFLDIRSRTQGWECTGLMGVAFHPEFGQAGSPNRGYFYVYYHFSQNPTGGPDRPEGDLPGFYRISRFTVADGAIAADPNSEQILVHQYDRHLWHAGGAMFFGSDGFLYWSVGDEGAGNDIFLASQKLNAGLFGGVCRVDVDRNPAKSHPIRRAPGSTDPNAPASFSGNYFIPNDNPFQDASGGILEEFFALGLRSPHRMSFDPPTGDIWVGDVGQETWEEIDRIKRGGNYQWPYREGKAPGPKARPSPLIGTEVPPIHVYQHLGGDNAVIVGPVYRGTEHAQFLDGWLIFGDNGSGRIFGLRADGANPVQVVHLATLPASSFLGLSGFGTDAEGEVHLCQMGSEGKLFHLARSSVDDTTPMPTRLSQLGVFTDLRTLQPHAGLLGYDVNTALWSDGASKKRWMGLPFSGGAGQAGEQIGFSTQSEWEFPSGTVFIKHFELGVDDTNPNVKRRMETRVLVRDAETTVYGYTYRWRADQTEADLVSETATEEISIRTAGGSRKQTWFYPGPRDCMTCHTANSGSVLGIKTHQINGHFTYPSGRSDNQLRTWNHLNLFSNALNEADIAGYPASVAVTNESKPLELRVKSYLAANCAQCHRPNGGQSYWDARFHVPIQSQGIIEGAVVNSLGIEGAKIVSRGSPERSTLHHRMNSLEAGIKMPLLAKFLVDTGAVAVVRQWILGLPPEESLQGWLNQDVGSVGLNGSASLSGDQFNIVGAGDDIWDTADGFHFVYVPLTGDGELIARVDSLQRTSGFAKAGLMVRSSLDPGSPNAMVMATGENGLAFQYRQVSGGTSSLQSGPFITTPVYLRIVRAGDLVSGFCSLDGIHWQAIGSQSLTLPGTVLIGMAVTSHDRTQRCSAVFSKVIPPAEATPPPPPPSGNVLAPWIAGDVGSPTNPGSAKQSGASFTVQAAGKGIAGRSDQFQFVSQTRTGDFDISARVDALEKLYPRTKAGLMVRADRSANEAHAMVMLTKRGVQYQRRIRIGSSTTSKSGPRHTAGAWIRLNRVGNTFSSFTSLDGTNWTLVRSEVLSLPSSVEVGMAVTSHKRSSVATAKFSSVRFE